MVEHFHPRLSLACSFQREESVLLDMLLAIEPEARVFALDTHVLFPRRTTSGVRSRSATGSRSRSTRARRSAGRRRRMETRSGSATRRSAARFARSARSARRSRASTAGSQASAASSPSTRAGREEARLGRAPRAVAGEPARRLDAGRGRRVHRRARATGEPAARARLRLDRLHALHGARRGPRGPLERHGQDGVRAPHGLGSMSATLHRSHLDQLEDEAVHIIREVAAELERPVLLFSGGKDSIVLLRLAEKAFRPGRFPFPLMHVDTGHNFPEVIEFRDRRVDELGERLVVASVQESIDRGRVVEQTGPRASRNQLQTTTLLDAMEAARVRRGDRRRAAGRGALAREGADLLLPRRLRPVGSAGAAARALERLQRQDPQGRAGAGLPDLELDGARRLAVRRPRGARAAVDLLRARARRVRARRDALRGLSGRRADRGRGAVRRVGAVPHGGRHELHRRGALAGHDVRRGRRRDRGDARDRARARPAPTTAPRRPRWRTASVSATSDLSALDLSTAADWTCSGSSPAAPSTTASRR